MCFGRSFVLGFTINIYVEIFHSEKQFDELEIFDGIIYMFSVNTCMHTLTERKTHTHTHAPFLTASFDCRFFRTKSSLGSVEWQPFISTQLHIEDQPTVLKMVH